jgi:hypothetical protein
MVIRSGLESTNNGRIRLFQTPTKVTMAIAAMIGLDSGSTIRT